MITQEKEFDFHRIGLGRHQHGRRFIVLDHQYGCRDIMLNTPLEENCVHRND